ncbi:MAG: type II/IV secretion system ATPase subunit [Halobacteriaceae archaeon]
MADTRVPDDGARAETPPGGAGGGADAGGDAPAPPAVPAPVPPDDPDAWYAPDVRAQRTVAPGVVATVRTTGADDDTFRYEVREPPLAAADEAALAAIHDHFADTRPTRPRTREGVRERMAAGLGGKYGRILDRLVDRPAAARRRVDYYALRDLRLLGELTPLALDERVAVADAAPETLRVHTEDFAPAVTDFDPDHEYLDRVLAEELERYDVRFRDFDVPVVIYRERVLGGDAFEVQYAVLEPDLLPGDRELIEATKERIWETSVGGVIASADGSDPGAVDATGEPSVDTIEDRTAFVASRARTHLSRRLTARNTRAWRETLTYRARRVLAEYGLGVPPVDDRFDDDRLEDLLYYVLRDFVGDDKLTVPIRDDRLEDVEANRVGERVKVVPRPEIGTGRIPTNLAFESETRFTNLVTQLAARDGVELNASNPTAKVNVEPRETGGDVTIRCAVGLPTVSEDGPHVSIRKQSPDALSPVDLVGLDALSSEMVALLWLAYEHHRVVVFAGPTGVGKTTLMNAHMPFVRYDDRPVSIDEGSREVRLPHETGVSLTTRDHESAYKRVTMADLMTETNYLNPDVEVIAEINTPASFETFGEVLNTGHGVLGTTHAESVEALVNRAIEQGLPSYLLQEVDLVVLPKHVDGERYVAEIAELVTADAAADLADAGTLDGGVAEKDGATVHWNRVAHRDHDGTFRHAYAHPDLGDDRRELGHRLFHRVADATDRPVDAVEAEYRRKVRYVRYLVEEGMSDFDDLAAFLADLQNDEAATVERLGEGR